MEKMLKLEKNPAKRRALEEDMKFLVDQRDIRKRHGAIGGMDLRLAAAEKKKMTKIARKAEREKILEERRRKDIANATLPSLGKFSQFNFGIQYG